MNDWTESAPCREIDPDLWFPERGQNPHPLVKATCARCKFRDPCLEIALSIDSGSVYGVWGGLTTSQIRRFRKQLRDQQVAA